MVNNQQEKPESESNPNAGRDVNIISGSVNAEIIAQGSKTTITVNKHGSDAAELVQLLQPVFAAIEARPTDPNVDKEELVEALTKIQSEAAAPEPNDHKILRWLGNLGEMAPDIAEVVASSLANPMAGVVMGVSKIAKKYLKDRQGRTD